MQYRFKEIETWPGEKTPTHRRRSQYQFKAGFQDTLNRLEYELEKLGASNVIIQVDCDGSQIRMDGMLRSDAKVRGPGVILTFDSKHGPLSYPCDTSAVWQHNVRQIALALEALRAVDRYGVTRRAEQYRGWAKIGGPVQLPPPRMTVHEAAELLSGESTSYTPLEIVQVANLFRDAYRQGAAKTHPDRNGGDDSRFKRLQEAKAILEKHHGI